MGGRTNSVWRGLRLPRREVSDSATREPPPRFEPAERRGGWPELLKWTFDIDVLQCPRCNGRMKPLAMLTEPKSTTAYITQQL